MKLGKLDLVIENKKEESLRHLSVDLSEYLHGLIKEGIPILFLSSGGSALSVLDYLELSGSDFGKNFTISVLDERYGVENKNSNFAQLMETNFSEKAKDAGAQFIDTRVKSGQTKEGLVEYFEEQLKKWIDLNPNGKIVATAGIGVDGHTAGIMPMVNNTELFATLFEGSEIVVGYEAVENKFSNRVTTTMIFLRMIDRVFILMLGQEKTYAFSSIQNTGELNEVPARIWKEIDGSVYVDKSVIKS